MSEKRTEKPNLQATIVFGDDFLEGADTLTELKEWRRRGLLLIRVLDVAIAEWREGHVGRIVGSKKVEVMLDDLNDERDNIKLPILRKVTQ